MNFFAAILLLSVSQSMTSATNQQLNQTNVCRQMEEYPVEVMVTEKVLYQQRFNEWCWQIPPRCSIYKPAYKTEIKVQTLMKTRMVERCCPGYETIGDSKSTCQPVCSKGCGNGTCVNPEKCLCWDGSDSCAGRLDSTELNSNDVESSTKIATRLNGPNVCIDYKEHPIDVKVNEQQPYQELQSEWCLKVPPRCSVLKNITRTVAKTITVLEIRPVKICCDGYKQNSAGTECVKI